MESFGGYLCGLAILSVFFALSLGAAAANAPVGAGMDIIKIIGVNYMDVDQWIEIVNEGTGWMNLTGWTLTNMENQTYSFPADFNLKAGSTVRVHSREGDNTAADLFNSALAWNRQGDTATLKDETGKVVFQYNYPIEVSAPGSGTEIRPLSLPSTRFSSGMPATFQAGYRSDYSAQRGELKPRPPANLTGRPFICHGGPLNWAWTTGSR